ncbi:hypothetical protein [Methanosarcina sp.]|uniref:hypothetical protein n=1 Tax=Methanosarcina sp. TaxID=2213 RepID=UPI003BB7F06A
MSPDKINLNGDKMKTNENIDVNAEPMIENISSEHRNLKIKTSNEDLVCIISYKNNKWFTQFKYKLEFLPPIPSKAPLYEVNNVRDGQLIDSLIVGKIVEDKSTAKEILQEVQKTAFQLSGQINHLTFAPEKSHKEKPEEPEKLDIKDLLIEQYGETVFDKAQQLINDGHAQKFIVEKHCSTYAGVSDRISWALSCVFAVTHISSSVGGVHLKLSGPAGNGKNTLVTNFTNLTIPEVWRMTTPSGKNMFYNDWIKPNMVVIIDEFDNGDKDIIKTLKLSTSRFQDKTMLDTVILFAAKTKIMPERIAFIIMSVLPLENEEMIQRYLTVDVPNNIKYLAAINEKQKGREHNLPTTNNAPDFDTQVCRCIYHILNQAVYDIRIPFAPVIEWQNVERTRNWELFADIIRCSAFYNIPNREYFHKPGDEETGVFLASYEDYENAVEIYDKLADNNVTKLSTNELKLIDTLIQERKRDIESTMNRDSAEAIKNINREVKPLDMEEITQFGVMDIAGSMDIIGLAKATGISDKTIDSMLHGKQNTEGLTGRIVGLHSEKVAIQGTNHVVHKRKIWYDGPDNVVTSIPKVPRDKCDAETIRCKQNWIEAWQLEDAKWNRCS